MELSTTKWNLTIKLKYNSGFHSRKWLVWAQCLAKIASDWLVWKSFRQIYFETRKPFFLRHTTLLPSSTSQLVWSGPCLGGFSSTSTSGGYLGTAVPWCWGGYLGTVVPWQWGGCPLPPALPGSSSTSTSGFFFHQYFQGVPLPPVLLGSSSTSTSGGPMWPIPMMHLMLPLLSRHQLMGLSWCSYLYTAAPVHHGIRSHGDPPELNRQTDWQTNTTENITFPHTTYVGGNK